MKLPITWLATLLACALAHGATLSGTVERQPSYDIQLSLSASNCHYDGETSSVTRRPDSGGPQGASTDAVKQCCSFAGSGVQTSQNSDGTWNASIVCGHVPGEPNPPPFFTSEVDIVPSGTDSFAFSSSLPPYSIYTIAIASVPRGRVCTTPSSIIGLIDGAGSDVANIDVECYDDTIFYGGFD